MSDADTAYAKAQERIAHAAKTGAVILDLGGKDFNSLDRLPLEIADLKGLQVLDLRETEITDLSPLTSLTELHDLCLFYTRISDLAPLSDMTGLQALRANYTQIADITPLAGLSALQILDLRGTLVVNLAPLRVSTTLQTLDLAYTQVSEIAPLAGLTTLRTLDLADTAILGLSPLAGLTQLRTLFLSGTPVVDLAPLAGLSGLRMLSLFGSQITDIMPLASLTRLKTLHLGGTPITDLRPLTDLTELEVLGLDNTQVTDLRPIARLDKLATGIYGGLFFQNTPATQHDARLERLSQIDDDEDRTRETLDYLRTLPPWPEPYTPAASPDEVSPQPIEKVQSPPDQDPALSLIWGKNGFDFFANSINTDPVTEAALADLRDLLNDLTRKGNQHDDLFRIAAELQERSAGAISDLNMVKLHLSYQKLRRLHQGRAARQVTFDDETVSTMEAVFDVLPGVTLADDGVKVLIERQEAERATGLPAAQDDAAMRLLQDVQDPDAPFSPEVKDIAAELLRPDVNDRLAGTRQILSRNVVVSVFKFVGGAMAAGAIGGPVGNFIYENGGHLLAYAATMGNDALFWAQSVMAKFRVEYELAMGITREIAGATTPRKPPPNP